jgi:glycosyltransferase involved in cell wall biosynthesis
MYRNQSIGVVVPAFNEELLIQDTLSRIPAYADRIYAIDDGSTDTTFACISEAAVKDSRIIPLHHDTNRGLGASVATGYLKALEDKVDVVAVMDGDNQMDPAFLAGLLDPIIEKRCDFGLGNRLFNHRYREGMSRWRYFGNTLLTFMVKAISGYWNIVDPTNGYTAISRQALLKIEPPTLYKGYGFGIDRLVRLNVAGCRVTNIPIPARYGKERSKIRYHSYIIRVSGLMLKDLFWRLETKYIVRTFHPLVLLYISGIVLLIAGCVGLVDLLISLFISGLSLPSLLVYSAGAIGLSILLLLSATLIDIRQQDHDFKNVRQEA